MSLKNCSEYSPIGQTAIPYFINVVNELVPYLLNIKIVDKNVNCMAEAGIAAYGAAIGVAITLAIVCFALRGKGHADESHNHDYDKVTSDETHVHVNE